MGEGWVTEKAFTPGVGLGNKLRILGMKMQEIKNTLTEMKNVFYGLRKRLVGESINELQDKSGEITQNEIKSNFF